MTTRTRNTANLLYQYVDGEVFKTERNQLKLLFRCPFCPATRTLHVYLDGTPIDFSAAVNHVLQEHPDKFKVLAEEAIVERCNVLMVKKHQEIAVKFYGVHIP